MADDLDSVESIFNELASDNLPEAVMAEYRKAFEAGSVTIAEVDPDYGSWEDNSDLDASELESKAFQSLPYSMRMTARAGCSQGCCSIRHPMRPFSAGIRNIRPGTAGNTLY